jgi:hypothetical protein
VTNTNAPVIEFFSMDMTGGTGIDHYVVQMRPLRSTTWLQATTRPFDGVDFFNGYTLLAGPYYGADLEFIGNYNSGIVARICAVDAGGLQSNWAEATMLWPEFVEF